MKMQRQALEVTIAELSHLIATLLDEQARIRETTKIEIDWPHRYEQRFIVPIINETGESDKWRIEGGKNAV